MEKEYLNTYDDIVEDRVRKPLETIINLPKEERVKVFWETVGNKKEKEALYILLLKAYNEKIFFQLESLTEEGAEKRRKKFRENIGDLTIYGDAKTEFVPDIWIDAINKTVQEIKFDKYKFIVKMKNNYTLLYGEKQAELLNQGHSDIALDRKKIKRKCRAAYLKQMNILSKTLLFDSEDEKYEAVRKAVQESNSKFTKNICAEVEADMKRGNDYSYDDIEFEGCEEREWCSPEDEMVKGEDTKEKLKILDMWMKIIKEQIRLSSVEKNECLRIFLTRDILIELKLTEENCNKGNKEPYVGSLNRTRYTEYPAGNEDVYFLLGQNEDFFMEDLFHKRYLECALQKYPEDIDKLYGIYCNFLNQEFEFKESLMEDIAHIRSFDYKIKKYNEQKKTLYEKITKYL